MIESILETLSFLWNIAQQFAMEMLIIAIIVLIGYKNK